MLGRSAVPFVAAGSQEPVRALDRAEIVISSEGLPWSGLRVEAGFNPPWEVHDLAVPAHYIALNTDTVPLRFEAMVDGRSRSVTLNPGQMWFCPAGASFSHRVPTPAGFTLATIDPSRVARVLGEQGRAVELRRTYEVERPQLEHLIRALAAEAERGGPSGALFVDALGTALASQIVDAFGVEKRATPTTGISPATLHQVYTFIDANLGESLTVDAMAASARLSPAHFARAFKDATGISPHRFVMKRRLEEARRALERRNADVLNVALRFGFSDQAHLTRLFKQEFGVTPGKFSRQRAGE